MPELKYKARLQQILKDALYQDWMDDKDWKDTEQHILQTAGTTYEAVEAEIDAAVAKGYLPEYIIGIWEKSIKGGIND